MEGSRVREAPSFERRRWRRARLAVPVRFGKGTEATAQQRFPWVGLARDVSAGGSYVTTSGRGVFVPGDLLTVSMVIPWELRRLFPFSRIAGPSRVVRVEEVSTETDEPQTGLALEFCLDRLTRLGAIVTS